MYRIGPLRVEKIFLIAFSAGNAAGLHAEDDEARFFSGSAHARDGAFVQLRIADDAAFADKFLFEFELRLDEDEKNRAGRRDGNESGQNFRDGDEGNVDGDDAGRFRDVGGLEEARIFLDWNDACVALELPIELGDVHVDGVNATRAVLEQAIGKAAVGRANVEADAIANIDAEISESAFEFQARSAGVFCVGSKDFDLCVRGGGFAGLARELTIDADLTGHDHGLRALARGREAALDKEHVDASSFGVHD